MKKIIISLCAALLVFTACRKETKPAVTVGIAKIITHPALDAIEKGIQDELKDQGYDNIKYDVQSANGEMSTAASIANKFRSENVTIAVGIATPTALAIANQIKDRTVVFSGVTDPIGAGLRSTLAPEKTNIIGVSDMAPVKEQIKLITELLPVKKIGHIYTPSEANSITMMHMAQKACDEMGIELVLGAVTNTAEVKQAAEVIAPRVDAIYISNDNTVVAALTGVTATALKYKVPVISADPSSAEQAGVAVAYGIDNYQTGRATGRLIARLLSGEKPSEMPVKLMNEPSELASYVNRPLVKSLGLKIPDYIQK